MPKAILEFNLPEERDEYKLATQGADLYLAIRDFDEFLRNVAKYGGEDEWKGKEDAAQLAREKLAEIVRDRNLENIWE